MPMLHSLMAATMLGLSLLAAIALDIRSRRIPNWLVLTGAASALVVHGLALMTGGEALAGLAWWTPLAGMATGFMLLLPLHLLRAMGAGDVKLMAMVGAFIGPGAVATATLYTLLAGGLLSLLFMLGRGVAAQTLGNLRFMFNDWAFRAQTGQGARLPPLQTTAARLPYAVAIAAGTAAALLWPLAGP